MSGLVGRRAVFDRCVFTFKAFIGVFRGKGIHGILYTLRRFTALDIFCLELRTKKHKRKNGAIFMLVVYIVRLQVVSAYHQLFYSFLHTDSQPSSRDSAMMPFIIKKGLSTMK